MWCFARNKILLVDGLRSQFINTNLKEHTKKWTIMSSTSPLVMCEQHPYSCYNECEGRPSLHQYTAYCQLNLLYLMGRQNWVSIIAGNGKITTMCYPFLSLCVFVNDRMNWMVFPSYWITYSLVSYQHTLTVNTAPWYITVRVSSIARHWCNLQPTGFAPRINLAPSSPKKIFKILLS